MAVEFKEIGFDEAVRFLKSLDDKVNRRLLAASLRVASRPLVREAKRRAPVAERNMREFWGEQRKVPPGTLKKSIGTILPKRKRDTLAEMFVGPRKTKPGRKRIKNDAWFRHMVIRGTAGYTIKKGTRAGQFMPGQPANPFMDQAKAATASQVTNSLEKSITKAVNNYIKRKGIKVIT